MPTPTEVTVDSPVHNWHIEEREYRRHEQRRGRRHAFESLEPRRTALVVIDMVSFFVEHSPYARGIVPRINVLASSVRTSGGTVAWVVPGHREPSATECEFFGREIAESYAHSGGTDDPEARLWHELAYEANDVTAEKTASSAYFPGRCPLPGILAERDINTIIVTGTVTNVCVEATVRDASTEGMRVILAADASAARRDQDHNATLHTAYRSYGDVRSCEEVIQLIGHGKG